MINGIQLKVCGLTSAKDAGYAYKAGADYLGFILYPKSPRYLSLENYGTIRGQIPTIKRVAVLVEPSVDELRRVVAAGFDRYQIHFSAGDVAAWSDVVGADRLWLAPRLPPGSALPASLLPLTATFLVDTFHRDKFGGTGETGDWPRFAELTRLHPDKTWILSGGLNPQNIPEAVAATGAKFIDVNSGVEASPGVKDPAKLQALAAALG